MANPFNSLLEYIYKTFRKDASKMIICTTVIGWTLSGIAQTLAILFNPKYTDEEKSFLAPQELTDAAIGIGSYFLITLLTKKTVSNLFSNGKFAPKSVREFLNKNSKLYGDKVGKIDFKLDDILKNNKSFPTNDYYNTKNFGINLATITAGVIASNVVTPLIRNSMASKMHKNYINAKKTFLNETNNTQNNTYKTNSLNYRPKYDMRI